MVTNDSKNLGKRVLGISGYYHDAAAALVIDGKIIAASQEERFSRSKHDASFPSVAIQYCLNEAKITLAEIDAVVFYDKPLLTLERLLETYLIIAPRGVRSFVSAAISGVKQKFFLKKHILRELCKIDSSASPQILFTEHHLSHAASAFYPSPFSDAAIVTIDGVGEWATTSISKGADRLITPLTEIHFPHSIGLLYSSFTYYLGFEINEGEYKLMGLAPYGRRNSSEVQKFKDIIFEHLVKQNGDGSFVLNQAYFTYTSNTTMVNDEVWKTIFKFRRRSPEEDIQQRHCDFALAIQEVTETLILGIVRHAKEITGSEYLCLAGGVALNCVANSKIKKAKIFKDVWIQPAAGDAGGALGGALAATYLYFNQPREIMLPDSMAGSYLGPSFSDAYIESLLQKNDAAYTYECDASLIKKTAELIGDGHIIGWFQGRMEWGSRALGNRSILADPRLRTMQNKINTKVKLREDFRPFAPSVLFEHVQDIFKDAYNSPYMLFVNDLQESLRNALPQQYSELSISKKLDIEKSHLPAVTHVDFSSRIQTVTQELNSKYWNLIHAYFKNTGVPLIVNTSFNVSGEPIVCTPEDAYSCFMKTDIDYLVIGNFIVQKPAGSYINHTFDYE